MDLKSLRQKNIIARARRSLEVQPVQPIIEESKKIEEEVKIEEKIIEVPVQEIKEEEPVVEEIIQEEEEKPIPVKSTSKKKSSKPENRVYMVTEDIE